MAEFDWEQKIDMAKLRKYRDNRLEIEMKKYGIDAFITMRVDNIRYITSFRAVTVPTFFWCRYSAVKVVGQSPYLMVASGDYDRAMNDMPWLEGRVKPLPMEIMLSIPVFVNVFNELGIRDCLLYTSPSPRD